MFDSAGIQKDIYNKEFSKYVSKFSKVDLNYKRLQSVSSDLCGMYCLFFLLNRLNGVSFSNIINMFSKNTNYNDTFVYNSIVNTFPECLYNYCKYMQKSVPLKMYL